MRKTMESALDALAVLEAWRAEEARVRSRSPGIGLGTAPQLAGKTGLEVMQAMIEGKLARPPIGDTLDFILIDAASGRAVFQGRPLARHYNPLGTVHGGWFATLLDSALGCAVHCSLPAGKSYTTAELKINIVRPLTDKVPLVRAEGQVIHLGGRMATADGRLTGPDGKLYAHASTTCFIFDTP